MLILSSISCFVNNLKALNNLDVLKFNVSCFAQDFRLHLESDPESSPVKCVTAPRPPKQLKKEPRESEPQGNCATDFSTWFDRFCGKNKPPFKRNVSQKKTQMAQNQTLRVGTNDLGFCIALCHSQGHLSSTEMLLGCGVGKRRNPTKFFPFLCNKSVKLPYFGWLLLLIWLLLILFCFF